MPDFLSPTILNQLKLYRYKVYLTIFNLRYRDQSHFLAKNNFSQQKMVFVQIYISGPGPWSSQSVSYFSGQWSRSATGGIHARPNFPGFSCLATFVIYTTTQTQTHLRQNIAKTKNTLEKMAAPMSGLIFQTLPACLGTFVIYTNQCTNKNVSLIFSVLTLFSPPAVVGCTGNHFSFQRLFKINLRLCPK